MPNEIERKFLLNRPLAEVLALYPNRYQYRIEQQYLGETGKWTTRIRQIHGSEGPLYYLTFKRRLTDVSCIEIEDKISEKLYHQLEAQCGPALIKIRYEFEHKGHTWEVDQFLNPEFSGMVVAEIELSSEHEFFDIPDWLGQEVTHDKSYKNAKMVQRLI